jgi:hypothetical protein
MTTMTTDSFNPKLASLVTYMQNEMGINPLRLYCQITGKPIGRIEADELTPFLNNNHDVDSIADDLFVRIIASMRPSIHWNVMRESTLEAMAKARPIETLAYLMNRLFQPTEFYKLPLTRRLDDQHQRIKLYAFLETMDTAKLDSLYTMLIEVDAKMNLSQQQIDLRCVDFMLFLDESMITINRWYLDCIKRWNRTQQHNETQANWYKGNTVAKPAFFRDFIEAKPESKTAKSKRVAKAKDMELDALFDAVMQQAESADPIQAEVEAIAPTPTASPAPTFIRNPKPTPKPTSFAGRGAPSFLKGR